MSWQNYAKWTLLIGPLIIVGWVFLWAPIQTWPVYPSEDFIIMPKESIGDYILPIIPAIGFWGAMIGVGLYFIKEVLKAA